MASVRCSREREEDPLLLHTLRQEGVKEEMGQRKFYRQSYQPNVFITIICFDENQKEVEAKTK